MNLTVAGFHFGESFAWEKYLYVDGMVTDKNSGSKGFGDKMFQWLEDYAVRQNFQQIHLDSRVIRHSAHQFYINHGLIQGGYHIHKYL